jgi:hypothetical protein
VLYAAGGNADMTARVVAKKMSGNMGVPILIENKGGANGGIGTDLVAKAPAHGYTLQTVATIWPTGVPSQVLCLFQGMTWPCGLELMANPNTWANARRLLPSGSPNPSMSCGPSTYAVTQALALLTGTPKHDHF